VITTPCLKPGPAQQLLGLGYGAKAAARGPGWVLPCSRCFRAGFHCMLAIAERLLVAIKPTTGDPAACRVRADAGSACIQACSMQGQNACMHGQHACRVSTHAGMQGQHACRHAGSAALLVS
jgi:hypothetical protein